MLIDALAILFIGIFTGLFSLVPTFSMPSGFGDAGSSIGTALAAINGWVPVGTIALCIGAVLAVRVFLMLWSLLVFLYDRFPLKAT